MTETIKSKRQTIIMFSIILTTIFSVFVGIAVAPINAYAEGVVGTVVKIGDTIDFGGAYVAWNNSRPSNILDFSSVTIYSVEYDEFWNLWMLETNRELQDFYVKPNIADSTIAPVGFKVSGGTGTKLDPYTIEAIYGEYTVTYDANGADDGSVPTEESYSYSLGDSVIVLDNSRDLKKIDYHFDGWNTKADGTGTSYSAGESFKITQNTVLYAQWADSRTGQLVGKTVKMGGTIDFDYAFVTSNDPYIDIGPILRAGFFQLTNISWHNADEYWEFYGSGTYICIKGTSDLSAVGFKVSGGNGTEMDPYTFEIVYEEITHTHTLTKIDGIPATCEQEGYREYWKCSVCNKLFADNTAINEIDKPIEINPLGHDWGDWIVTRPATDDVYGEKTRVCKRDTNHIEVRTIDKLSHIPVIPSTQEGLQQGEDGGYYYCKDGEVDTEMNGYVDWNDSKFFLTNGKVDTTVNGVKLDDNGDSLVWYFCANGQVQTQHEGLAEYDDEWFYIENGKVATEMNKFVEYNGGLFAVAAGRIVSEYSGLMQDPEDPATGDWYFFANGQAQTQYTGLAMYDNAWFYVVNGKLAVDYTGNVDYDGSIFYVENGMVK